MHMQDDEILCEDSSHEDYLFDTAVGTLQDAIFEPQFALLLQQVTSASVTAHRHALASPGYAQQLQSVYRSFLDTVGSQVAATLSRAVPGADPAQLIHAIRSRPDEVSEEILEILNALNDPQSFAEYLNDVGN